MARRRRVRGGGKRKMGSRCERRRLQLLAKINRYIETGFKSRERGGGERKKIRKKKEVRKERGGERKKKCKRFDKTPLEHNKQ